MTITTTPATKPNSSNELAPVRTFGTYDQIL